MHVCMYCAEYVYIYISSPKPPATIEQLILSVPSPSYPNVIVHKKDEFHPFISQNIFLLLNAFGLRILSCKQVQ